MLMHSDDNTFFVLYTVIYVFLSACFVAPPTEFVSAGVTIQNLFSSWLGSEGLNFVYHHIKRSTLTLVIHSFIPLVYCIGLHLFAPELALFDLDETSTLWCGILLFSLVLPGIAILTAIIWCCGSYRYHPIVRRLSRLAGENETWRAVASSINIEFRRFDKFTSGTPGRLVVVTDSWIMKCSTYFVHISHQNDIHLSISDAEEHPLSYQNQGVSVQYLNITVGGIAGRSSPFVIRLNSFELGDLKEKLQSPIRNARNIVIHQSLSDRFLDAFREQIKQNSRFTPPDEMEIEQCIGCMQRPSNVKLQMCCRDSMGEEREETACQRCFCRPMWCMECMGKWFASRQNQQETETWMASQSPCPTCRARFCVLDVCPLQGASL